MATRDHDLRLIFSTASPDRAEAIAKTLVDEHLVGCVNVVRGVDSFYTWEGKTQHDQEVVLLMETRVEVLDRALARLSEIHGYSVPKILVLEPSAVNQPYLAWLRDVVS